MSQKEINIILTGATGTLGSQVLFEILTQKEVGTIFLLVRDKQGKSAKSRIQNILESDVAPDCISENKNNVWEKVKILTPDEFLNPSEFLSPTQKNFFIHSAGTVNLSTNPSQRNLIFKGVFELTKTIFNSFSPYLNKFTCISTAFSIGNIGGLIKNDYHTTQEPKYRNFYEEAKHKTEKYLLQKGKETGVEIQILRPSVLGGNIFPKSPYFISNYMVYYLLGKFFYHNPSIGNSIRIIANFKTGLNIIPVDYVAKVIATVYKKNVTQLNIVHAKSANIIKGMTRIMKTVDFNDFSFLDSANGPPFIESQNKLEKIYYKTIGLHLNQYLTSKPYEFDTQLLESFIPIPKYDMNDYLENTISYAKSTKFKSIDW